MSNSMSALRFVSIPLICALAGCSALPSLDEVIPDRRTEYRKAESLPDLEIPPDLSTEAIGDSMPIPETADGAATYTTYQQRVARQTRAREVTESQNAAVQVLENEHVLAVPGAVVQVWPDLVIFWQDLGYSLDLNDEELGVMETEWRENAADLSRDKFKVFAEPGDQPGTTVLYVSHVAETLTPSGEGLVWQPAERDVELERLLVDRLAESFGAAAEIASYGSAVQTPVAGAGGSAQSAGGVVSEVVSAGGGKVYLSVSADYDSVWVLTEQGLEANSLEIDDIDEDLGMFTVIIPNAEEGEKSGGMLSRLKFWGDDEAELDPRVYKVSLTNVGGRTEIVVLNSLDEWSDRDEARRIITILDDYIGS